MLKKRELAASLAVCIDTIDGFINEGCPFIDVRVPGTSKAQYRFLLPEVMAWLRARDERKFEAANPVERIQIQMKKEPNA